MPGHVAASACRSAPRTGPGTSRTERLYLRAPCRLADLGGSTQLAAASIPPGPEPPAGGLVTTIRGKSSSDYGPVLGSLINLNIRAGTKFPARRPLDRARPGS